jgi:hypothetical protein
VVIVDTDVLLLAYAFPRDERQQANRAFLERVRSDYPATTIYNLAERTPTVERLVTWNARHFQSKTWLEVLTPEAYLEKA